MVKVLDSGSESLLTKLPVTTVFLPADLISSVATGGSGTSVTVMINVPVAVPPFPSLTVYVTVGTVPT